MTWRKKNSFLFLKDWRNRQNWSIAKILLMTGTSNYCKKNLKESATCWKFCTLAMQIFLVNSSRTYVFSLFLIAFPFFIFRYMQSSYCKQKNNVKKKKRVETIVEILGKKIIQVSQQNLDTGISPWHDTKQCLILYDINFFKSIKYYNCSLQCL